MTDAVSCPWCGVSVEVRQADLVPAYPKAFKWPAPCCGKAIVITRHGGKLHVQKPQAQPSSGTPATGLPS